MNEEENKGSIKKGVWLVLKTHLIYCFFSLILCLKVIGFFFLAFIWLIQFIYVIPMAIHFKKEKETLKGILITSGITFVLCCGICGAMMLPNMFK